MSRKLFGIFTKLAFASNGYKMLSNAASATIMEMPYEFAITCSFFFVIPEIFAKGPSC